MLSFGVLIIMLCMLAISFESMHEIMTFDHSVKVLEQCFPGVLFIILYKVAISNRYTMHG